jgi:hypothetical protein
MLKLGDYGGPLRDQPEAGAKSAKEQTFAETEDSSDIAPRKDARKNGVLCRERTQRSQRGSGMAAKR